MKKPNTIVVGVAGAATAAALAVGGAALANSQLTPTSPSMSYGGARSGAGSGPGQGLWQGEEREPGQDREPGLGRDRGPGLGDVALTGEAKAKAETAAKAKEPTATVIRSEKDRTGSGYHVHMTRTDGTHITVLLDSTFAVTSVSVGHPMGGQGGYQGGRHGQAPSDGPTGTSGSTSTTSFAI